MNQDPCLLYNGKLYGTGPSLKGFTVHVFVFSMIRYEARSVFIIQGEAVWHWS